MFSKSLMILAGGNQRASLVLRLARCQRCHPALEDKLLVEEAKPTCQISSQLAASLLALL